MEVAAQIVAPKYEDFEVAHDRATQMMSLLKNDTQISEEDRQLLQDFYHTLEQRNALLEQGLKLDLLDQEVDEDEIAPGDITETELQKAAEFPAFLKSLDPGDEAAKLLIDGSRRVIVALRTFENGANFLAHVPMQNIVETYERIKSREDRLKDGGTSVSLVNARLYASETVAFEKMVEEMIIMDMKAPTVDELSAEIEGRSS